MSKTYENLEAWQFAVKLVVKVYQITQDFPKEEFYGLTSQIRRAAISVSSNIAEGAGRSSKKEFKYFIDIAKGSLNETENLCIIARELKFFKDDKFQEIKNMTDQVGRLLNGLSRYLKEGQRQKVE